MDFKCGFCGILREAALKGCAQALGEHSVSTIISRVPLPTGWAGALDATARMAIEEGLFEKAAQVQPGLRERLLALLAGDTLEGRGLRHGEGVLP